MMPRQHRPVHDGRDVTLSRSMPLEAPLAVACLRQDKRMTRHILRKRLLLNWKWGPLNSYRINLGEIDSVGQMKSASDSSPALAGEMRSWRGCFLRWSRA
eukprot:4377847-Prymnesium_polylepis.2